MQTLSIRGTMHTNHKQRPSCGSNLVSTIPAEIREIASRIQRQAPNLTPAQQQSLRDLQRQDGRYQFRAVVLLAELSARCPQDSDAFRLGETLNAFVRSARPRPSLSLVCAIEDETRAQGEADLAELEVITHQTDPSVLRRGIDALITHRAKLQAAIEAIQTRLFSVSRATA